MELFTVILNAAELSLDGDDAVRFVAVVILVGIDNKNHNFVIFVQPISAYIFCNFVAICPSLAFGPTSAKQLTQKCAVPPSKLPSASLAEGS